MSVCQIEERDAGRAWDIDFMEAGWDDYDAGFSLGVTHWLDITGMWPGVTAQVASFHSQALAAAQEAGR